MNRNDVIDVLSAIHAADHRTIGEADIAFWDAAFAEAEKTQTTTKADAIAAVVKHAVTSSEYLKPVHVVTLARDIAHDRMMRETPAEREQRTAAIDAKTAHRRTVIQEFAGRTGRP